MPPPKDKTIEGIGGNSTVPRPAVENSTTDPVSVAQQRSFSEIFLHHTGYSSDKWAQYLPIYDFELQPMIACNRPLRLLEIGVQNGGSLQIWHEYLPRGSRICGIDINQRCRHLAFPPEVRVLIGDAGDPAILDEILGNEIFDIIIDDGSHQSTHVVSAFRTLLPRLAPGGKYFIEDLHASYWPSHGGGFRKCGTAIEHLKNLVDVLHADYFQLSEAVADLQRHSLTDLNSQISRISFHDSLAVIVKYPQPKMARYTRVLSGKDMGVTGPDYLIDDIAASPNGFAFFGRGSEDVISAAARRISDLHRELDRHRTDIEQRAATEASLRAEIEQRAATEASLRAQIEQRATTEASLRAQIEQRATTEASLRAEIEQRATTEASLRAEIEQRDATEAALRAEIEQHAITEAGLRTEIQQRATAEAVLLAGMEESAATEAALRAALGEAVRGVDDRVALLQATQSEIASMRDALAKANRELQERAASGQAWEAEIAVLRGKLAIADREERERAAAAEALEAEIDDLHSALSEAEPRREENDARVTELEAQITSLGVKLAAAREVGSAAVAALQADLSREKDWSALVPRRFGAALR